MAEEIIGLCSMATKQVLADLCQALSRDHGISVRFTAAGGVETARGVREGAAADVVVLAESAMSDLEAEGFLVAGSVRPTFVSEVVAAIPASAEPVALGGEEELRAALERAERIAFSTGPSGTALVQLLERWGLLSALEGRLVQAEPGVPVGRLLAGGQADLGFQQRSELQGVAGVRVLGTLPGSAAIRSIFSSGIAGSSAQPDRAAEAIDHLVDEALDDIVRVNGMARAVS